MYREAILQDHISRGHNNINERVANMVGFLDGGRWGTTRRTGENPAFMNIDGVNRDEMWNEKTRYSMRAQIMHHFGIANNPCGFNAVLYADKGFRNELHVTPVHKKAAGQAVLEEWKAAENSMMVPVRLAVENGFNEIAQRCKSIMTPVLNHTKENHFGKRFAIDVLLVNCSTCLYGSQV